VRERAARDRKRDEHGETRRAGPSRSRRARFL
jgi:hypothetical protein